MILNLHAEQIQHLQIVATELLTGGPGTFDYPELRQRMETMALDDLAHRVADLGMVAVGEPHIKLTLEVSVIHPGWLTPTQLLLTGRNP